MAFNWQTFKTRALTAIVFALVMLAGLLWNQWSFFILFSIIHFGCWWEYLKLIEKIHRTVFHAYVKLGLMLMGYGIMIWYCGPSYEIEEYSLKANMSFPISGAGFALLIVGIFQKNRVSLRSFGVAALGFIYISLSWGMMIDLRSSAPEFDLHIYDTFYVIDPRVIPIAIVASIWINDTMAYIVGSLIGKTPLSKISPKKTWEGTIGGIILCVAVIGFLLPFLYFSTHDMTVSVFFLVIAAIASIMGTIGDLLESKLKRMADVKDSGTLMPGHGGFLDRFDSLLIAIPFVWLFLALTFN